MGGKRTAGGPLLKMGTRGSNGIPRSHVQNAAKSLPIPIRIPSSLPASRLLAVAELVLAGGHPSVICIRLI